MTAPGQQHTAPHFVLRYFFDGVTCLWAGNEATVNAFDYPVDLYMLNLPDSLLSFGNQVIGRWTALAYQAETVKNEIDWAIFREHARQFLFILREYLGAEFEIQDETGITVPRPVTSSVSKSN